MDPLKKEHLSLGLFISGAILLLLAINFMQNSPLFTETETIFTTIIAGAAMISAVMLIMHSEFVHSYLWLESHKLVKVNNFVVVLIAFILSVLLSALFVRSAGDFLIFYLSSIVIIVILGIVQYHKAIKELIDKHQTKT